eukprot:COSAG01_NODE_494_length_16322_cov_35.380879_10_plen_119_part_00
MERKGISVTDSVRIMEISDLRWRWPSGGRARSGQRVQPRLVDSQFWCCLRWVWRVEAANRRQPDPVRASHEPSFEARMAAVSSEHWLAVRMMELTVLIMTLRLTVPATKDTSLERRWY